MADTPPPTGRTHAEGGETRPAVVYAGGYVNKLDARRLERECRLRLEEGCRALVINFRDTELVNSIGVSILLDVIDAAETAGAHVVFSNVNQHNRQLFDMLGLTKHAGLAETEEAALDAVKSSSSAATNQGH
ncbi:MAG TPA: STAS domain-containing protein [Pyrinomonadaceae bacterium]|nr:STAS domain-containing protein [Pyrinomonadaceae bacterium]